MRNNNATLECGHNERLTALPPRPIKTGEVVAATSPQNENYAEKPELITRGNCITATSPVDSEISIIAGVTPTGLNLNHCELDGIEDHDQMVVEQVVLEGGTIDAAREVLCNLYWYGSRHAPQEFASDELDGSAFFRAVCGGPCEG